jgi:hypothetical protein
MNIIKRLDKLLKEESVIFESGFRNMKSLSKKWKRAKIYFHKDCDGVTSAIAIKKYLEDYGIKVVDAQEIQYGGEEYAVKKTPKDVMPVLVDFGHNKINMVLYTDHHDHTELERKTGVEGQSRLLPKTPSNAEFISQIISPSDIFPAKDIQVISTVDSADFAKYGLHPDDIANSIFTVDGSKTIQKNHQLMGLVTNKLLLSYKNKPGFLSEVVLKSKPSLISMYNTIIKIAKREGYKTPEELQQGTQNYKDQRLSKKLEVGKPQEIPSMKNGESFIYGTTIFQKGGGYMGGKNTYDRYTIFSLYPDADYLITQWPMGMIQLSANPFTSKKNPVHLGDVMMKKIMPKFKSDLQRRNITLDRLKYEAERDIKKKRIKGAMGFNWAEFEALYKGKIKGLEKEHSDWWPNMVKDITNKPYRFLSDKQKNVLKKIKVSAWDVIMASSGGHRNITNLSGLNFLDDTKDMMNKISMAISEYMKDKRMV